MSMKIHGNFKVNPKDVNAVDCSIREYVQWEGLSPAFSWKPEARWYHKLLDFDSMKNYKYSYEYTLELYVGGRKMTFRYNTEVEMRKVYDKVVDYLDRLR